MQHGRCITFKEEKIMVVQHNLTAMNANRQLGITTGQQAKSSEKLSSGSKSTVQQMMQRINNF